jgi:hypothetical protein
MPNLRELAMSSTLDISRYQVARRFLQEGRRDWVLVLVGELLPTHSGRPLALRLLAEMYRETSGTRLPDELAAFDRGV